MRRAWLVLLAGCSFDTTLGRPGDGGVDAPSTDAAPLDAQPDARVAPFCDTTDSSLLACYEFENTTQDASPNMLDATMTNVAFVAGKVGLAMEFGATSAADIADSTKIDVASLTVEAWINPAQLPGAGQRAGIADMNGQWGLFVHEPTGRLQCTMVGGVSMQIDANIAANTWTHVACTYDAGTTTIYVNGVNRFQQGGGGALSTGGTSGISLGADNPPGSGSRLIGLIDQVRLFSRARTAAEVCADAACLP